MRAAGNALRKTGHYHYHHSSFIIHHPLTRSNPNVKLAQYLRSPLILTLTLT